MFTSFISSEAIFQFPDGLKGKSVYSTGEKKSNSTGEKKSIARIKYLYKNSYGVKGPEIKDKSDHVELYKLITQAYIPYLERCCSEGHPLVYELPSGNELPSGIRIAHGGVQADKTSINDILNSNYCNFITALEKKPYSREELHTAGLLGPSFYAAASKSTSDVQKQADDIQTYTKLADNSAPAAISEITQGEITDYNGPIWTRFWQLDNSGVDLRRLIGICGHAPLGKLPMVYANNLCCDTTLADDGLKPEKRPAMGIEARLLSHECWRFDITLEIPVEAFCNGISKEITNYYIHNNAMEVNNFDVDQDKRLYKHYVGRTSIDNTVYSIWRTVLVETTLKPNNKFFWFAKPTYILVSVQQSTDESKDETKDKDVLTYNIISDIEGNLPFFVKSLALGKPENQLLLLGDTWDRGTTEEELQIWKLIQQHQAICIVGNRDANKVRWICELNNDFDWDE